MSNKINPYFQKIFRGASLAGTQRPPCQVLIFYTKDAHWKKSLLSKKWEVCPEVSLWDVFAAALYICCYGLWKTPVDNSVENVENFDLSTVIPVLCRIRQAVRSRTFGLHNTLRTVPPRDVMSPGDTRHFLSNHSEKVGAV